MAAARASKPRAPRRHWSPAEKRRIVELSLRAGSSAGAIAREHGVHPNSLCLWKSLYRAGKLEPQAAPQPRVRVSATSPTFLPVALISAVRRPQPASRADANASGRVALQLELNSGVTVRIETDALDAAFVCTLLAELRR